MVKSHNCFPLKQQNRYLSVIIVCEYFSFIRSFTWLNFPSQSNSYHKTSLSKSFGCWPKYHFSVAFCSLYNSVTEEIRTAMSIKHHFMHLKWLKGEIPATFITCIPRITTLSNNMHSLSRRLTDFDLIFFCILADG